MCRSIVVLRGEQPATPTEVEAASRQYVRKVAGARVPSKANEEVFERAVEEVARATARLLEQWVTPHGARPLATPKSRAVARAKAAR
ncbi:MAG TPA: DUF2277 domain-containing protein [Acidimicrobiales bacterium]|nr:DUF2277 domain-containing protein [Acidimicrobiales bacterium]